MNFIPFSAAGLENYRPVTFCLIFNKTWCICEDFHVKTDSLQDLLVNFSIYLKRAEIKFLITVISKAIGCKWSLLFMGLQNFALVSFKNLICVDAAKNNTL